MPVWRPWQRHDPPVDASCVDLVRIPATAAAVCRSEHHGCAHLADLGDDDLRPAQAEGVSQAF